MSTLKYGTSDPFTRGLAAITLVLLLVSTVAAAETPEQRLERLTQESRAQYAELTEAYFNGDQERVNELTRRLRLARNLLEPDQYRDVMTIARSKQEFRPKWWSRLDNTSPTSFEAEIWGRPFIANYLPSDQLGVQAVIPEVEWVRTRGGYEQQITGLKVLVTWQPHHIGSQDPADGALAKELGLTRGDLAEVIVWHELGHNYLTVNLPVKHVVELYTQYALLYAHLQEFFADLTAIYHATPRAKRAAMLFRLNEFDHYVENEPHTRAALMIGSMFLAEVMTHPNDWPSIHFPPAVPESNVEMETIKYVYENWDPDWSVSEAIALGEWAETFVKKKGDRTFKSKGEAELASGLTFNLMSVEDRPNQEKRDAWVARKLEELIREGRADKQEEADAHEGQGSRRIDISGLINR